MLSLAKDKGKILGMGRPVMGGYGKNTANKAMKGMVGR